MPRLSKCIPGTLFEGSAQARTSCQPSPACCRRAPRIWSPAKPTDEEPAVRSSWLVTNSTQCTNKYVLKIDGNCQTCGWQYFALCKPGTSTRNKHTTLGVGQIRLEPENTCLEEFPLRDFIFGFQGWVPNRPSKNCPWQCLATCPQERLSEISENKKTALATSPTATPGTIPEPQSRNVPKHQSLSRDPKDFSCFGIICTFGFDEKRTC